MIDQNKIKTKADNDAEIIAANNAAIDAELRAMHMSVLDDLVDYISSKPDAPQLLKEHNALAAAKRNERK